MLLFGLMILSLSFAITLAIAAGSGLAETIAATPHNGISAPSATINGSTVLQNMPISIIAAPGGTFEITYNWQLRR